MSLNKFYALLLVILNITATMSLRFFQSRKKIKTCLVRDEWNVHNVTCTSKYQKCCPTGCCDSPVNNPTSTYVKVFLVCSVITLLFTIIYTEAWFKRKWHLLTNRCRKTEMNEGLKKLDETCQELRVIGGEEENG